MDPAKLGPSTAYGNIVEKIKTNVYKRNAETLKKNRANAGKTLQRLTRKLAANGKKQEKGTQAKIQKLSYLVSLMDAMEQPAPVPAPPAAKKPRQPKKALPVPKPSTKPAASPHPAAPTPEIAAILDNLHADFFATQAKLTQSQLEMTLKYVSDVYYNNGISLIMDEEYDRLRETLLTKYGTSEIAAAVGAEVKKAKIKLPYYMGSMDKIKPDKNNLESWRLRYPGRVVISDKLDGISALVVQDGASRVLYTRGDGTVGQNISHMLPHIRIGTCPGMSKYAVRGELIVSKANYDEVKEGKRGARQMVAGLANQKKLTKETLALMARIDFVAYEVIVPESLTPSEQFTLLNTKSTFITANWSTEPSVSIESLSNILTARKAASKYEIDGIIVAHDAPHVRQVGKNPEYAFAFKMAFADQAAITEVLAVAWEASKDGYLKPTVQFEPVNIGGVVIQYATGFNASYIQTNGIGPGAYIEIIRSGDVIPYIKEVKAPSPTGPQMPSVAWTWNPTHVDALLESAESNPEVQKSILLHFANTLEIAYCGPGNIEKLYAAGVKTPADLVNVKAAALVAAGAFTAKGAEKLVGEIAAAAAKATLPQWMVGSGVFGRGFGLKRATALAEHLPANFLSSNVDVVPVLRAAGWPVDAVEEMAANLADFKRFMARLPIKPAAKVPSPPRAVSGKLTGQTVLFTGFHPKDLEAAVVANGGTLADTFSSKITLLVIKDASVSNEKTKKAEKLAIRTVTADQFKAMLA